MLSVDGAEIEGADEDAGENIGILVATKNGTSPAKLSIARSTVTAEGDTAAILVYVTSKDGSIAGTIELEGSLIQTPAGGRVSDYNVKYENWDGTTAYDVGQTIGLSGATIDSLSSADIVKSTVIAPPAAAEPSGGEASGSSSTTVTQAAARTSTASGATIPQTGDESAASVLLAGLAGMSLLASGLFVSRKRS